MAVSKASLIGTDLVRGPVAMSGVELGCVVAGDERLQAAPQFFDGVEGLHPQ